jgi:hypothetical protein
MLRTLDPTWFRMDCIVVDCEYSEDGVEEGMLDRVRLEADEPTGQRTVY